MISNGILVFLFLCLNTSLINAQECKEYKKAIEDYYQCIGKCYKTLLKFENADKGICSDGVNLKQDDLQQYSSRDVADSVECVTVTCTGPLKDLLCGGSSTTIDNLTETLIDSTTDDFKTSSNNQKTTLSIENESSTYISEYYYDCIEPVEEIKKKSSFTADSENKRKVNSSIDDNYFTQKPFSMDDDSEYNSISTFLFDGDATVPIDETFSSTIDTTDSSDMVTPSYYGEISTPDDYSNLNTFGSAAESSKSNEFWPSDLNDENSQAIQNSGAFLSNNVRNINGYSAVPFSDIYSAANGFRPNSLGYANSQNNQAPVYTNRRRNISPAFGLSETQNDRYLTNYYPVPYNFNNQDRPPSQSSAFQPLTYANGMSVASTFAGDGSNSFPNARYISGAASSPNVSPDVQNSYGSMGNIGNYGNRKNYGYDDVRNIDTYAVGNNMANSFSSADAGAYYQQARNQGSYPMAGNRRNFGSERTFETGRSFGARRNFESGGNSKARSNSESSTYLGSRENYGLNRENPNIDSTYSGSNYRSNSFSNTGSATNGQNQNYLSDQSGNGNVNSNEMKFNVGDDTYVINGDQIKWHKNGKLMEVFPLN